MNSCLHLKLNSIKDCKKIAKSFATFFLAYFNTENNNSGLSILHFGNLGVGKTTFIKNFVSFLPNHQEAEVSSPSFTIYSLYPTRPPVYHFDLYRIISGYTEENIDEVLSNINKQRIILCVEWTEHLKKSIFPADRLELYWQIITNNIRQLTVNAFGRTQAILIDLKNSLPDHLQIKD